MTEVNPEEFNFLDVVDAPPVEEPKQKKATRKAPVKKAAAVEQNVHGSDTPDPINMADLDERPAAKPKKKPARPAHIEIDDDLKKAGEEKQTLVMTIMRYQNSKRFGGYLKENGLINKCETLNKKSAEELKELLVRIRFSVSNRGTDSFIDEMIKAGMSGAEALISAKTKYKVTGMTNMCFTDDEWLDCYELCRLEYMSFSYIRPELRLMLSTFRIGATVHAINTHPSLAHIQAKPEFKPETQREERPDNITEAHPPQVVSTKGIKESNSTTLGRASNLIEPEFD